MLKRILFSILLFTPFIALSQSNKADSLRQLLKKTNIADTSLVKIYSQLGEQIYETQPDTAIKLWTRTVDISDRAIKQNPSEAEKKVLLTEHSTALNNIGFIEQMRGKPNLALHYFKKSLVISKQLKDYKSIAIAYNNIGYNLVHLGNTAGALEYYNKSLFTSIKYGTKAEVIRSLMVMGDQYSQMKDFKNAIGYFQKAQKMTTGESLWREAADINIQLGNVYKKALQPNEAITYYLKSLDINQKYKNQKGISTCYNNLGASYFEIKEYPKALYYFRQSLAVPGSNTNIDAHNKYINLGFAHTKLNNRDSGLYYLNKSLQLAEKHANKQLIFSSLSHICLNYFNDNNIGKAEEYGVKALKIAEATGYPEYIESASDLLRKVYVTKKNYKEAYTMYKLSVTMRDSLHNIETEKAGINSRLKYEYDLKTVADSIKIAEERKLTDTKLKQEKNQRYVLFAGIFLITVFAGFMYDRFKKTQKQKVIIEQKEKETQQQKHLLQEKNKEILDSINYAKRLQEAILPSRKVWESLLPDSFVYYLPKDIVAGDFYWIEKIGSKILFAAADCTGHGVPGAMVSVVCSNALNRVVKEFGISEPNEILAKVRELVIETFEKSEREVNDGMDISLCCLNTDTNILSWSGANNPLWLVRNNELTEIKADKQPIGKHTITKPFTKNTINLKNGDTIYIFTDGLPDQFGGPKGKKFKYKQLETILLKNSVLQLPRQMELLHHSFIEWKANLEQVDDICVIGVRVN